MTKILLALTAAALIAGPITAGPVPLVAAQYQQGALVTPNDSTDIPATKAVWVGGAGNLNVDFYQGPTVLISGIAAGTLLPIKVKRIRAATTTATLIVALY